ncbi:hypothetical protein POM88_006181 [Heracleum sosnowskyi]|uniref:SKP1 component POZ domain-containing protein n=1 Tax=Heracleum sosnowskyi TaxID=360622 RepID=A0AAD8N541_9APIA|nr:hypothetical protein POM88_006180 [Heracleum sosnowskyi]KAK1396318.1 hypothetical protein POM88_006181 [Heracleum sosnowskyi]
MSWEKMIMLKSSDGLILKVEEAVVLECGALVEFIEKSDESDINAIQIHGVNFSTLGKVMEYCKQQARKEDTESLGAKLVNADPITVFHLVHAAYELKIRSLMDLAFQSFGNMIGKNSFEDMTKMFHGEAKARRIAKWK